jgi:hypothetical protein
MTQISQNYFNYQFQQTEFLSRNSETDQIGFCLSCHFDMSVAIEKSWKLIVLLEVTSKISHPKGFEMTYKLLKHKNTLFGQPQNSLEIC